MLSKIFFFHKKSICIALFSLCLISACTSTSNQNLYRALGGQVKINEIVDNFINEIAFDERTYTFFKDSNMDRFKEKLSEQLCMLSDGPCSYTGDSMEMVHSGMRITESDFNHAVDLFIKAMNTANIPHTLQNRLIKKMAETRDQMLYK